ncbi:hypothetical protein IM511_04675 [Erythrobacteraceae bacterium E2-1 Yellow Sea]|nr:hypothetical protein [Erythrobacteraceae bacterium E2-1 Yellow Sea]
MADRLYSLCCMNDGVHWLLISANGDIEEFSECPFASEEEALIDLQYRY